MEKDGLAKSSDSSVEKEGLISQNLSKDGIPNPAHMHVLQQVYFSFL